jgi:transcriptional regulator with GAF, ATPase, and Fis domain
LIDVNPETITSELFGHEKGAFTGAQKRHYGLFEQAHRGVLFIDEVGELPHEIQAKLLRVLDQRSFRRMGGTEDIRVDVQLVTATNRSLEEMVRREQFRQDLYYRLKVFEIYIPPLRERNDDILLLAEYFLHHLRNKGRTTAETFTDDAIHLMQDYHWPGNVRELKSAVESSALRCKLEGGKRITGKHLVPLLFGTNPSPGSSQSLGNVFKKLAETELGLVSEALIQSGGRKTEAWRLLEYPNRFSMLRRIKRLLNEYPELLEKFPEVKKSYL